MNEGDVVRHCVPTSQSITMPFENIHKVMEFIQRHSGPKKSCNNFNSIYSVLSAVLAATHH